MKVFWVVWNNSRKPAEKLFNPYEFKHKFAVYGFDFTPGHTGRGNLLLIKKENLNVNMYFAAPLLEEAICIAMLPFDNIIEIKNNRQVTFDFAP